MTSFTLGIKYLRGIPPFYGDRVNEIKCAMDYLDYVEDKGKEFAEKYNGATYVISDDGGYTFGDVKKVPINCPHGPAVTPDGRLVYVGKEPGSDENDGKLECYIMNNKDEFEYISTFEWTGVKYDYIGEPYTICLPDGKLITHIRFQRGNDEEGSQVFTIFQTESSDGGKTWTKPHQILGDHGGAPAHILRLKNGTLISVYGYRVEGYYGLRALLSKDNGETWDTDNIIFNDGFNWDIGYPCSVELKDGNILTVFYGTVTPDVPTVIQQIIWNFEE